jgi:light-regulated signal transduction histidine kinase (bacteriophytochrome)
VCIVHACERLSGPQARLRVLLLFFARAFDGSRTKRVSAALGVRGKLRYDRHVSAEQTVEAGDFVREKNSDAPSELGLLRAQLAARDRDIAQLLHVVSHDLRAPLRAVVGFTELLREGAGEEDAERQGYLRYVVGSAREMQEMLAALDAYARVTRRKSREQRVDAGLSFELARRELLPRIRSVAAEIEVVGLVHVMADADQLTSVWGALLANALTFCTQPPRISVRAERCEREVIFSVLDRGIGIAEANRERVFGLFVRLHRRDEFPGRGVGLALARRVVEHHGGRIWIEADEQNATCVRFTLPAAV